MNEEDELLEDVFKILKGDNRSSWMFAAKRADGDGQEFTELKGNLSDNDAFLFIKHLVKDRPETRVALRAWLWK